MSTINFTRNYICKQRVAALHEGFLCIELLQGLLILGVLLLLISAFHVLSVHWQHQAIKRFEALDLLASELAEVSSGQVSSGIQAMRLTCATKTIQIPELAAIIGKPVVIQQKIVSATWQDERKKDHSIRMVS